MINYPELFLFTTLMLVGIVSALNPLRFKRSFKVVLKYPIIFNKIIKFYDL